MIYRGLIFGAGLGAMVLLMAVVRYRFLLYSSSADFFILVLAAMFMALGLWAGLGLRSKRVRSDTFFETGNVNSDAPFGLTEREREVLLRLASGMSNREIADELFVSVNTVKTHIAAIFSKLGVRRRTEAVHQALSVGLILPCDSTKSPFRMMPGKEHDG